MDSSGRVLGVCPRNSMMHLHRFRVPQPGMMTVAGILAPPEMALAPKATCVGPWGISRGHVVWQ